MAIVNVRKNGVEFENKLLKAMNKNMDMEEVKLNTRADILAYNEELLVEYKAEEGGDNLPVNDVVSLGGILKDKETMDKFTDSEKYVLPLIVGVGTGGNPVIVDLAENTNILISGASGTGKSWAVKSLIHNLAVSNHPGDVSFLIIDHKNSGEYTCTEGLPHVLGVYGGVYTGEHTMHLEEIKAEMGRRTALLSKLGLSTWEDLRNEVKLRPEMLHKFPRLYVVMEEMSAVLRELSGEGNGAKEKYINLMTDIAKQSRSLGIRLVIVSQNTSDSEVPRELSSECSVKLMYKLREIDLDRVEMLPKVYKGNDLDIMEALMTKGVAVFKEDSLFEPRIIRTLGIGGYTETQVANIFRVLAVSWQSQLTETYFEDTFKELGLMDKRLANRQEVLTLSANRENILIRRKVIDMLETMGY